MNCSGLDRRSGQCLATGVDRTNDIMEREITREQPRASKLGFDSFLGDVFGLNLLGLKSLWVAIKDPARYADAARDKRWLDKYTPSFRIWFGLMAVIGLVRFFAADIADMATAALPEMTGELKESLTEVGLDPDEYLKRIYIRTYSLYGLGLLPFLAIVAAVFPLFPVKAPYVLRLRWTFAVILPGTAFSAMTSFAMPFAHELFANLTVWAVLVALVFGLDLTTAYRGPLDKLQPKKRFGIALGFATLLFIANALGMITLSIFASAYTVEEMMLANTP